MRRTALVAVFASIAMIGTFPMESRAFGLRRSGGCCESSPCAAPCEVAVPAPPKLVERVVTRYRPEWKEQEVTVNVCRMVPREEKFNYALYDPVAKQESRKVTTYQRVTKEI